MESIASKSSTSIEVADLYTLRRIRDMWANRCTDDEIQDVLAIDKNEWKRLMVVLKENALPDNHIEFEKFTARLERRAKELERIRNHAEAIEELGTAVKCVQLENEMDRAVLEFGQKLGVLKPEIIKVQGQVQHDVRLAALFATVPDDLKAQAEADLKELTQELITEGLMVTDDESRKDKGTPS